MSEQEKFLARWSRRKLDPAEDAAAAADEKAATQTEGRAAKETDALSPPAAPEPAFDLESLPSLESIGPNSDIRAFLQPGVPGALSRAALRRAWSADPAIRDFIGLAENSWDFTVPNEITGFGPLDPQEAARQLARFLGDEASGKNDKNDKSDKSEKPAAPETAQISQSEPRDAGLTEENVPALPAKDETAGADIAATSGTPQPSEDLLHRNDDDGAAQQKDPAPAASVVASRRGHGGALPD